MCMYMYIEQTNICIKVEQNTVMIEDVILQLTERTNE